METCGVGHDNRWQVDRISISSRTPDGQFNSCPVCGKALHIEPSVPSRDAPCPHCGSLLWFEKLESRSRRSRILLADRNEANLALYKSHLTDVDCAIRVVTDGADVFDSVFQWEPNLILLSQSMPTVGGFEICRQIKSNSATRKAMVLMVLDLNKLSDIEHAVEVGTNDFVSKPISRTELLNRVENMLQLSRIPPLPT